MNRGFTLIELLVVVMIIAILAAIAIPNFLAAQTRAKVSRSKADLRTVVTSLESYAADHNRYPTYHYSSTADPMTSFHVGGKVPAFPVPDPDWDGRNPLTTPIAYITAMPADPFGRTLSSDPAEVRQFLYVNWQYAIERSQGQEPIHSLFIRTAESYGAYRLHSKGPDLDGPDTGLPYDPTNGSVSDGDITYGPKTGFDRFVPE